MNDLADLYEKYRQSSTEVDERNEDLQSKQALHYQMLKCYDLYRFIGKFVNRRQSEADRFFVQLDKSTEKVLKAT